MDTDAPSTLQLTTCPQCGAPAEILHRHTLPSTDGPIEHARMCCIDGHAFMLPTATLARPPRRRTTSTRRPTRR